MRWGRFKLRGGGGGAPARQWGGGRPVCVVKNPRKLKGKQHTNYPRSEDVTTAIEKNPGYDPPAIVFFLQRKDLFQSRSILSC